MLSPYRIQPNNTNKRTKKVSNTNSDKNLHREPDVERLQMTSNDVVKPETNMKSNRGNKNIVKTGSIQGNIEINEHNLGEILNIDDIKMDLAMQIISTDKTVRNDRYFTIFKRIELTIFSSTSQEM